MPDQKIVTCISESTEDTPSEFVLHQDIQKAAAYVVENYGRACYPKGSGVRRIKEALEGKPLTQPITVSHDCGYVTFAPVQENP
jgi:hypothetical protein